MQSQEIFEPQALVRRFSEKLVDSVDAGETEPSTIQNIVADDFRGARRIERQDAQWRKWFDPWTPAHRPQSRLESEALALSRTWYAFREKLKDKMKPGERASFGESPPTMQEIISLMGSIGTRWDRERKEGTLGTIRTWYQKCCIKIKSHETMLSVLPEESEYVSLFTGVLKSIVYATANHEKVAASFSKALAEISDTVSRCEEVLEFYSNEQAQELMMDLYSSIFSFLNDVLDWYLQKRRTRMIGSFNEDLYDDFQGLIQEIHRKAEFIRNDAMLQGQAAELRSTRITGEVTQGFLRDLNQTMRAHWEEEKRQREAMERRLLASEQGRVERQQQLESLLVMRSNNLLEDVARNVINAADFQKSFLRVTDGQSRSRSASPLAGESASSEVQEVPDTPRTYLKQDILGASRELESYFERGQVRIRYDASSVSVPRKAVGPLQDWIKSQQSSLLSIAGPQSLHAFGPNPTSKVAAAVVGFADQAKIPVFSYFCHVEASRKRAKGETAQTQAMVALVYSLLRQLLELLPTEFTTSSPEFQESRFVALDGTYTSLQHAMRLLSTAFEQAPPMLYCIIDNFHLVDDVSTTSAVKALVAFLRRQSRRSAGYQRLFKVLFTTAGRSRYLDKRLSRDEKVIAEQRGRAQNQLLSL